MLKSSLTQDSIRAEQEPVKDKGLLAGFTCMHLLVDTTLSSSFVLDGGTFECQQYWNDQLGVGRLALHSLILVSYYFSLVLVPSSVSVKTFYTHTHTEIRLNSSDAASGAQGSVWAAGESAITIA